MLVVDKKKFSDLYSKSVCPVGLIDPIKRVVIYGNQKFESAIKNFQLMSGKNIFYDSEEFIQMMEKSANQISVQGYHDKDIDRYIELVPVYIKDAAGDLQLALQCSILLMEALHDSHFEPRVLETLPGNLWACSPNGEVFWTSRRSNMYACGSPEVPELEHGNHVQRIHPDDVQMAFEKLSTGIADGVVEPYTYRFLSHEGHYEWFNLQMEPVRGIDGEIKYWLGNSVNINTIMHDVELIKQENLNLQQQLADAKALASAAQKMDLVSHLVGGIAHDLNNMLFVMRMHMGSLQQRMADPQTQSSVLAVQECIGRAARLSTQISSFSGRLPQNAQALEPERMLDEVYQLLSRAVGAEVTFHIRIEPGLPAVMADRAYLENALINLLINAKDAVGGRGSVHLIVQQVAKTDADGAQHNYVAFRVQDQGCGMSPEVQAKIFDPFYTTKPQGKGTGLGLAMVKNFVDSSKGFVELESEPGVGTTFSVVLPVALAAEVQAQEAASHRPTLARGVGTVLLIEDDEAVRQVVSLILREHGYRIVAALNPDHAMALLQAGVVVDLIVSDLRMPGKKTVLDLIAHVEAFCPTPIIFITGYSADLVIEEGLLQARYPVLFKPFEAYELLQKMDTVLSKNNAHGVMLN